MIVVKELSDIDRIDYIKLLNNMSPNTVTLLPTITQTKWELAK